MEPSPKSPLPISGHNTFDIDRILLSALFKIQKEKCLVLLNRTSQRKSILITQMFRLWACVEVVPRVGCRTLKIPPAAAMERVAALLQHHVDDRAAIVAELRREAIVLYLELLHDLNRRLVVNV